MKRFFLTLPMIAVLLLIAAQALADDRAYTIFKEGLTLENSLKIFEARDRFRDAVRLEPDNAGYREHYAWFLSSNGFHSEAIDVFNRLLSLPAPQKEYYQGLGWNEKVVGRQANSLAAYEKVFEITVPRDDLRKVSDEVRLKLAQENEGAIAKVKDTLSKTPDDPAALKKLQQLYIGQNDLDNALVIGEKLQAIHSADLPSRLEFARILFWNGQKSRAEIAYQSLLADSPDNAFLYFELGTIQNAMNKLAEARLSLEKSLSLYPNSARVKKELAEVLARMGKSEEALTLASSIDGSGETWLTGRLALARTYHFSGRLMDAIPVYKQILTEYPDNSDALWGLAECATFTGNFVESEAALAKLQLTGDDQRLATQKKLLARFAAPVARLNAEYYANSSDFTRVSGGADMRLFAGMSTTLDAGYYFSKFRQDRFSAISRQTVFIEGETRLAEKLRIGGRLTGNFYDNNQDHLNGRFSLYLEPVKELVIAANYEHLDIIDTELPFGNAIFNYVVTIGAVGRKLQTNDYSLYIQGNPTERIVLAGKILHGDYSDGNRKLIFMLDANFRLSAIPQIKAGYNFFYLDYRDAAPTYTEGSASTAAYYDPNSFAGHTLYLEFKHEVTPSLAYGLEERASLIAKSGGFGNSLFGFITYAASETSSLRLDARYFYQNRGYARQQAGGHFSAENFIISYNYRF